MTLKLDLSKQEANQDDTLFAQEWELIALRVFGIVGKSYAELTVFKTEW